MNLRNIDLNLLVILDAVLAEKSVTRAAKRLGMSASGVSHALDRLRRTFNDPLIERTPRGMVPTQRAQDLGRHVREALKELRHGLAQQLSFDPATSERSFNIRLSDFLTGCLLPRLCARVRAEAPAIRLIVGHLEAEGRDRKKPATSSFASMPPSTGGSIGENGSGAIGSWSRCGMAIRRCSGR